MSKFEFRVGVHDGLIVVMEPTSHFYAVYGKPQGQRRLILERRRPTKDQKLVGSGAQGCTCQGARVGVDPLAGARNHEYAEGLRFNPN